MRNHKGVRISETLQELVNSVHNNYNSESITEKILENRIKIIDNAKKFHEDAGTLTYPLNEEIERLEKTENHFFILSSHQPNLMPYSGVIRKLTLLEAVKRRLEALHSIPAISLHLISDESFPDRWIKTAQLPDVTTKEGRLDISNSEIKKKPHNRLTGYGNYPIRTSAIPKPSTTILSMWKEKIEYWRWREYRKTVSSQSWRDANIITAGVDVGSVSSKAVIMADHKIFSYSVMRTGSNSPDSAVKVMDWAVEGTGLTLTDMKYIVGTGYGRINVPMANKAVTEIACHAKGANYIWGSTVRTILDVGGQDIKAIRCDEKGRVTSFLMNDKCAAGTGRGMEVFADLLKIPIEEIGEVSLKVDVEPDPVSCTCVVFAKTEAIGLLRKGWPREKVLAAYTRAMAVRMSKLLEKVGYEKDFVITGGQSKNIGIMTRIENIIGLKCLPIPTYKENGLDPMIAGAIGAALYAKALYEKSQTA